MMARMELQRVPADAGAGYAVHDGLAAGGGYLGAVAVQDPVALLASGAL
jgi:hypothetical protein